MSDPKSSLMNDGLVVVRARKGETIYYRGRRLVVHGLHGSLHVVDAEFALRMLELGRVKLPEAATRGQLRRYVAAAAPGKAQ